MQSSFLPPAWTALTPNEHELLWEVWQFNRNILFSKWRLSVCLRVFKETSLFCEICRWVSCDDTVPFLFQQQMWSLCAKLHYRPFWNRFFCLFIFFPGSVFSGCLLGYALGLCLQHSASLTRSWFYKDSTSGAAPTISWQSIKLKIVGDFLPQCE